MLSSVFTWAATAIALAGTVLNCRKMTACFYLWLVANAAWFIYDMACGLYSRAVLDTVQFILACYGIYEWRRIPNAPANGKDGTP